MSDTKWADVAHYYQFSDIEIQIGIGQRKFKGVSQHDSVRGGIKRALFQDSGGMFTRSTEYEISEYKPILIHRDDMTEAEARELWEIQIGEAWVQDTDETAIQCLFFNIGNSQMEMADNATFLSVLVGEPKAWNYLISRGFDLFGLIESGQAIRKEMGNGNS